MNTSPSTNQRRDATLPRKRVLVVNCYFDDTRRPIRRTTKVPQAMGPVYLAGALGLLVLILGIWLLVIELRSGLPRR